MSDKFKNPNPQYWLTRFSDKQKYTLSRSQVTGGENKGPYNSYLKALAAQAQLI
jgi:hypothetical protein